MDTATPERVSETFEVPQNCVSYTEMIEGKFQETQGENAQLFSDYEFLVSDQFDLSTNLSKIKSCEQSGYLYGMMLTMMSTDDGYEEALQMFGQDTGNCEEIDLGEAYVSTMDVYVGNYINGMKVTLSDGTNFTLGKKDRKDSITSWDLSDGVSRIIGLIGSELDERILTIQAILYDSTCANTAYDTWTVELAEQQAQDQLAEELRISE